MIPALDIGTTFDRLPNGYMFLCDEDSTSSCAYPLYGRVIEDIKSLSPHKAEVTLGWFTSEGCYDPSYKTPNRSAVVYVYGELGNGNS